MNIYEARKLQKLLVKSSGAEPRVGSCFNHFDGKFCYYVSHLLSKYSSFSYLDKELINVIHTRCNTFNLKYIIIVDDPMFNSKYPMSRFGIKLIEIIEVD